MDVDAPAIAPKRGPVIVRVGNIVVGAAIPDFEIDDVTTATVDEMVPTRVALWKAGNHPRPDHFLPGLGDQSRLAFELVPMAQRRGGARRQARQVHAERCEPERIAERTLLARQRGRANARDRPRRGAAQPTPCREPEMVGDLIQTGGPRSRANLYGTPGGLGAR